MKTATLEKAFVMHIRKQGRFICREVSLPNDKGDSWGANGMERVDMVAMERPYSWNGQKHTSSFKKTTWRFYEFKVTKADFKSNNKLSFKGNFNYYVIPKTLYDKLQPEDFKPGIGIYIVHEKSEKWDKDYYSVECMKKPKRKEMNIDDDIMKHRFITALAREAEKKYTGV